MTPLDALHAVYARGERCRECPRCYYEVETERLSGRTTVHQRLRCCDVIESQHYTFARDPTDCPGVEDELNREGEKS